MKFLLFYFLTLCFTSHSWSNIMRPFQTARLHSTAGAGIASILLPEAAILNPATLAYFSESHVSIHQNRPKFTNQNEERIIDGSEQTKNTRQTGYFLFDNTGGVKGGITHQQLRENNVYRERTTGTMAKQLDGKLGFGVTYRYTHDRLNKDSSPRHKVSHQAVIGTTYIHSPSLSFGAIFEDPTQAIKEESFAGAGFQYSLTNELVFIGDYGLRPYKNKSNENMWRGAVQFNLFSDIFIRAGKYHDGIYNLEGFGWGLSWVTPKLVLDFGTKSSRSFSRNKEYLYKGEKVIDSALSVAIRL